MITKYSADHNAADHNSSGGPDDRRELIIEAR